MSYCFPPCFKNNSVIPKRQDFQNAEWLQCLILVCPENVNQCSSFFKKTSNHFHVYIWIFLVCEIKMNQIDDIYTAIKMHISNDFFFLVCVRNVEEFCSWKLDFYMGHIIDETFNCLGYVVSSKTPALLMLLYKLQLIHNIKCRSAGAFKNRWKFRSLR